MACDWLLIDGPSLIFRAYYGARRAGGAPSDRGEDPRTDAVRGFLDRLGRLIAQRRPRRIVIADDDDWRPAWRVELIPTYKAHRVAEPVPAGLVPQLPLIRELLDHVGIDMVGVPEYEAEDVIASLCRLATGTIEIVSGDRDLFALVEDPRVCILYPEKSGLAVIDEAQVTRRYGVPGRRYADFAILRGDPSDGLPGLKGVGNVGAAAMIRRHGDLATLLRERQLREPDRHYLEAAMQVVPPVSDLPISLPAGRRDAYPVDEPAVRAFAERYDLREPCERMVRALTSLALAPHPH